MFSAVSCGSGCHNHICVSVMQIYNRRTGACFEEKEYGAGALKFLYQTFVGRCLLKTIVARPWFSRWRARYQRSARSGKKIVPFVEKYGVDMTAWRGEEFASFQEFFTRAKNYATRAAEQELIAVADSKLAVYDIREDMTLKIKRCVYSLEEILQDGELARKYAKGSCLVFRLSVDDYHRYVYPDAGRCMRSWRIGGELHTIRPISEKYHVYCRNCREVSVLATEHFGEVTQIEVGALLVGKINNHGAKEFVRLQEKGYFDYGGSTIVLLIGEGIEIDEDIRQQSANGIETQVHIGEKIGICKERIGDK